MTTTPAVDTLAAARSPQYLKGLILAALIGIPISAVAYFFLALVDHLQTWVFKDLPDALGLSQGSTWWPVVPLVVAGVLVAAVIRYLPGRGGASPADGFHAGRGPAPVADLPGIALAALAGLALGAVIGPEAPLIALGGGLSAAVVRLRGGDGNPQAVAMFGATGSFAAISTLLGNPLVGAVLMMEASGLGGPMMGLALVPGLLASGVGYLIFVGLDSITGLGTFSLTLPDVTPVGTPQGSQILWAVAVGLAAAPVVWLIRRGALMLRPLVERRLLVMGALAGLAIALVAALYAGSTEGAPEDVLFSGQSALGPLVAQAGTLSVGTLLLLGLCKAVAYSVSLSSFRGGPVFPAMFVGAVGGILLSHLPGLPMEVGVGIGVGAMLSAMLRLPIVSVLLTFVFLADAGPGLLPSVIVAVVVAYAASAWLDPTAPLPRRRPAAPAGEAGRPAD